MSDGFWSFPGLIALAVVVVLSRATHLRGGYPHAIAPMPTRKHGIFWVVLASASLLFTSAGRQVGEEKAPPDMRFNDDLVRSNLCAFASAYHVFLPEALVTVRSILRFMPGMRVALAVHPAEFSVFNR